MNALRGFAKLSNNFFPKRLESCFLLDKKNDELYELTEDAFAFILQCDGKRRIEELKVPKRFLHTLLKNNIIELSEEPSAARIFRVSTPPLPSLRYMEIQLTERCNINCKHCYQGIKGTKEPAWRGLRKVLEQFAELQGLRVILSGGEPLLYRHFGRLNDYLKDYPAYVVLLSNGTLISDMSVKELNMDEIQFSLDGMEKGHDFIRGKGCFQKLRAGIEKIRSETDINISFATMAHRENIREFPAMKKFIKEMGGKEWGIDYPVIEGNLKNHREIYPDIADAVKVMKHRFGASFHATGEDGDYACGLHLMTLTPGGNFLPCGFYPEKVFGTIQDGLTAAVKNRRFIKLADIKECARCPSLSECRGGCRFRAGGIGKKDIVMCGVFCAG